MKILIRFNIAFLILAMLQCCTKYDQNPDIPRPIVEGYLIAGNPVSIRITQELTYGVTSTDGNTLALPNLDVSISVNNSVYKLAYTNNGYYITNDLIIQYGQSYNLAFNYGGKAITSSTSVPAKPANFTSSDTSMGVVPRTSNVFGNNSSNKVVQYYWTNPTNEYYMVVVANRDSLPALINANTSDRPRPVFRVQPAIVDNYTLREQIIQYYGIYNIVLFRLNPDYATLYNDNSNSSQNLTTPVTNISNGLGIFTGISSDTLPLLIYRN